MARALLTLIVALLLVPSYALAAEATFFGPIVPPECNCEDVAAPNGGTVDSAPDWGCVMQTIQNGMNFAVSISIIIILISIVYAGVLFMTSATNPSAREAGRRQVMNAFLGMLLVLSAWLLVDFIMKVLYNPSTEVAGVEFGAWNAILADEHAPQCIQPQANPTPLPPVTSTAPPVTSWESLSRGTGTGACDPRLVQQGAAMGSFPITNAEANTLACLARFESTCGAENLNYRWNHGSSAAGAFQVLLDGNSRAYENAACYQAAGVSGPLNCDQGFRGGNPIPGSAIAARCVRAASNLNCSASAAAYVLREQGFRAWVADPNSARQRQCIDRGGR